MSLDLLLFFVFLALLNGLDTPMYYLVAAYVDAEEHGIRNKGYFMALACIFYGTIPVLVYLALVYSHSGISRLCALFNVLSTVSVAILGHYMFNERLSSINIAGIALSCVSIVLINWNLFF